MDPELERMVREAASRDAGVIAVIQSIVTAVFLALVLIFVHGCGAGALAQHARGSVVAMVAVQLAADADLAALDAQEGACSDEACVHAVAAAHAPAEAALDLARTSVLLWRDAIVVANQAGDSPDLIVALVALAVRVMARWGEVVAALAGIGLEVPALPASVTGLVGT